ncbi:MAG TPA: hypothetical protein DC049_16245, partial [Spirochaetia bacterium]|nr:hypothetical protein [Spirochaetia bacterium]
KKVSCLNLYRKEYRDKIIADNTLILPASTLMTKYSGTEILTVENHFSSGLYMDIDHHVLHVHYPYIPCADPLEQGRHTAQLVSRHDFSFFEYFLTDTWAHRRSETAIKKIISCLNFFLEGLTESLALERHAVIITSDHGNMEEISINEHTLNPVPLVIITRNEQYLSAVRTVNPVNITDVYRLIVCMHEAENKIA